MTFIFQNFEIPSASMEQDAAHRRPRPGRPHRARPAHQLGALRLLPRRPARRHHRLLQARLRSPDLFLVKRAIGIPGDHIHLRNGIVYLNGVAQNEPQAGKPVDDGNPQHAYNAYRDDFPAIPPGPMTTTSPPPGPYDLPNHIQDGDLVVPPGKVFAMGDNRTESLDGRYWGFVPRENIVGRPMFVYWSFETPADQIDKQSIGDRIGFMGHILIHFFDQTRWKRTFHIIDKETSGAHRLPPALAQSFMQETDPIYEQRSHPEVPPCPTVLRACSSSLWRSRHPL